MLGRHPAGRLLAYLDGELPAPAVERVAAHLARCRRCREEMEDLRLAAESLRALPVRAAPMGLWPGVAAALDPPPRPWRLRWAPAAALLATVLIAVAVLRVQPGRWRVERIEGSGAAASTTRASSGAWIETGPQARARIAVGSIGEVEVEPHSRVRLLRTRPSGHRMALLRGAIHARIWAPPRLFFVETPSALAVDLGCVYTLSVDGAGDALLRVISGWVLLEDRRRESMVPGGAFCRSRSGAGPGLPVFEDAPEALRQAVAAFDRGSAAPDALLRHARPRDSLTLFHLLPRVADGHRPAVYDRLAALAPPPGGIAREQALALEPEALARWLDELAWTW